jgi:hypothetical protein
MTELDNLSTSDMLKPFLHDGISPPAITDKDYKSKHRPFTDYPHGLLHNSANLDVQIENSLLLDRLWQRLDYYIALFRRKQAIKKMRHIQ